MKKPERYTITAALPYANGPVHIGHLAGCYLPADIYARFLRLKNEEVLFVCGSDEHGVAITLKAKQENTTPQQVVDKYHALIKKSFNDFGISFDVYSRTSSKVHHETASGFFKELYDKGVFVKRSSKQYFDVKFKQFLADRYIFGACPNCGYEKAYGDQCERCGKSLDPQDLIEPKSVLSGEKPELRETEHWYLPLQDFEPWLKEWILENHKEWKTNVLGQTRSWLTQGLQERSVTRDLDWGIPVPLPDSEGKVLYVWFDAPLGYISATKEWAIDSARDWEPYWMDEGTKLVHFIGKDNIVFHCIIFPVVLKAHGGYILPDNVPANEFLNIEGEKVSTSRNWAVWLHEYMEDFPGKQDVLRYVLTSIAPETKDSDFTWKDFQSKNNNELAAILGNLVNRVAILTQKYFEGKIPKRGHAMDAENELAGEVKKYPELIGKLISEYKFREAQQELMNLCRLGNKYLTDQEPWKLWKSAPERTATILHYSLQLLGNIAILADPFLPGTSQKLRTMLDLESETWADAGSLKLLKEEESIRQPEILFEQIPDEVIEAQVAKLHGNKPASAGQASELPPFKPNISFDDFTKMDIRIATVKQAEKVPKTDKLLKLEIDLGNEQRTVVSGIAGYYAPETLAGKQVCMIVNLEPRKIKGITSQGMILMIENEKGELVFLQPERKVGEGSTVS